MWIHRLGLKRQWSSSCFSSRSLRRKSSYSTARWFRSKIDHLTRSKSTILCRNKNSRKPVVGGAGDEVLGELEKRVQQVGGQVVAAALRQKVRDHKEPSAGDHLWMSFITHFLQGVSKKRYFSDFLSYFSSKGRILLFHMCFGIRISSPFHLAIQKVSIQNLNCPKNACADMIFIPALRSED